MDYKSIEPTEHSGYRWHRGGMSMDYAMQEPTRESTIHHQVTELGETAQRLLKLTKMLAGKLGRVMGPDHGNMQAIREAPRPLGSPLAERGSEHVTMLGHVVENLQSIMARLDT
jgi:hypothetical protein